MWKPNYIPLEITMVKNSRSRRDLKEDLGISAATLAKIAKQEFISLKTVAQLCEYFKCDVTDIVTFKENFESETHS